VTADRGVEAEDGSAFRVAREAAAGFWRDGAAVLRGVVPREELDRIAAAVAALSDRGELADLSALAGADEAPRFRAGVDHWRGDEGFATIATTGVLPTVAAALLGTERLWLYEDSVLVKEAGSSVPTRWHTDDGYFHVEGDQLVTLWVPLDPAPVAAGALHFLAGSHRDDRRYRPTLFVTDDPIPGTVGSLPPDLPLDAPGVWAAGLEPGDLSAHHARTLHAARGNATGVARRALSLRYCGDDAVVAPKPGAPAKPGFDQVAPGTPLRDAAHLLGLPEAVPDRGR
jgi:ectoine hydroxylase-related dioxygenase (phytanoyl-CoA dioxygenase family)